MKRLLTGLLLAGFFFYATYLAPFAFFLPVISLVGVFCLYEFFGIVAASFPNAPDLRRNPIGYVAGLLFLILPSYEGTFLIVLALAAFLYSLRCRDLATALPVAIALLFGVVYVFGAWRCGTLLREQNPAWLIFALAINWVGDTFAYYAGRAFGRHKLAPRISPGKSWEGALASVLSVAILGTLFLRWHFPTLPLAAAITLSVSGNLVGQLGDLCESAVKRGAGVKDSGSMLPGHGGWLDRVDSSLFSVPLVYVLTQQPWFHP